MKPRVIIRDHARSSISDVCVPFSGHASGLGHDAAITQIAARHGDLAFSRYVLPTCPISAAATGVTGLSTCLVAGKTIMKKNGNPVPASPCADALQQLILWLSAVPKPVVLVAH
eukprot:scpid106835/ scgid19623/ 